MAKHALEVDVEAILADAKDRAIRTGLQNVPLDILAAGGSALWSALESGGDPFTAAFWITLGLSVGKTALLIASSYLMRLRKEPAAPAKG